MNTQSPFELLLVNGHVIDPSRDIDDVLDIAITNGKIAAVSANLDRTKAAKVLDLSGKYVCPGLIDLHGHWYEGSSYGIDSGICLNSGVTTAVDAGTTGHINFPHFRKTCIDRVELDILAFVHVGCLGIPSLRIGELEDIRYAHPIETAAMIEKNRDVTVGVKIREGTMTADHGIKALEMAITAAESVNVPIMIHISKSAPTPGILDRLRPGDILTHCFQGRGDGILKSLDGPLRDETQEARKRGVFFDVGHGAASFSWDAAVKAFEESFYPDTISTDVHRYNVEGPVYDMPTTLSKFLALGMSLQEVVLKSTWIPAQTIQRQDSIGSLEPGRAADLFVFEIETGDFEYLDTHEKTRKGDKRIVAHLTIKRGRVIEPGSQPFELREPAEKLQLNN